MNTALALKIEKKLNLEEGYFVLLQAYHNIEKEKLKQKLPLPDLNIIRPILFWDTKPEKLNWQKNKQIVIKRIYKYGNDQEKQELIRYYGMEVIKSILEK